MFSLGLPFKRLSFVSLPDEGRHLLPPSLTLWAYGRRLLSTYVSIIHLVSPHLCDARHLFLFDEVVVRPFRREL